MADAITIGPARSAPDLEAVRALCWQYRDTLLAVSDADREITETFYPVPKFAALMEGLEAAHARPGGLILLARRDGVPVGCGMSHALDPDTCEIKRVFVTEAARGRGVARRLCAELVAAARADGFARVVLDTSRSLVPAQRLYAGLGFALRGPYQPIPKAALPQLLFYEKSLVGDDV